MFHRLHERSLAKTRVIRGLSCDEDGVFIGGDCPLVTPVEIDGRRTYRPRAIEEINRALSAAYETEIDFTGRRPQLDRLAKLMTDGDWGLAQITALQMRLPELDDDAAVERLRKADRLMRFNPNHKPAGSGGGQFTTGDEAGTATGQSSTAGTKPNPIAAGGGGRGGHNPSKATANPGMMVKLPNGETLPDPNSPTGYLMSPVASLSDVVEAGRDVGSTFRTMLLSNSSAAAGASIYLFFAVKSNVSTGGKFDYQRKANGLNGFTQLRQFRAVADLNVGLFMQSTGLFSLDEILRISGLAAHYMSSNAKPDNPYGLDKITYEWIKRGYEVGARDLFKKISN